MDLEPRQVNNDDVDKIIEQFEDVKYLETSCLSGKGVKEAFLGLIRLLQGDQLQKSASFGWYKKNSKKVCVGVASACVCALLGICLWLLLDKKEIS
jgi:hypothetical protein